MFSATKLSLQKPWLRPSRIVDKTHGLIGATERRSKPRAEMFGHKMPMSTDILDFSKVESGKLDLEAVDLSVQDMIASVARLLVIQGHVKGIEIALNVAPNIPRLLRGDPGRIRQVLLNLGSNAVKFTERGKVSISATLIEQSASGVLVRFEVRDSGIGIPTERLSDLFQPFVQVDASTTRRFGGTGLGLSISRRLVELMGGTLDVSSALGEGSTF